jgi:Transcription factor WhiB
VDDASASSGHIGLVAFAVKAPDLKNPACAERGMALVFDAAMSGDELKVARALSVCRLCPARSPCLEFSLTLSEGERQGTVIGGRSYVTPKQPPGRPRSRQDQRTRPIVAGGMESHHPEVSAS